MGHPHSLRLFDAIRHALLALLVLFAFATTGTISTTAQAVDLPLAPRSPLAGIPFDDQPLALPVQRNFQMAMLTASSELARSCGRMEAYGWRMKQSEQDRVNRIFSTTVDHLRTAGYDVQSQSPTSVSQDITLFSADRSDRHFIFMWSAGELGLVMVLCETSAPMHYNNATSSKPSVQVFPQDDSVLQSTLAPPTNDGKHRSAVAHFTPVGDWVGGYVCDQGYTGGTLQIAHLKGDNFDGVFHFYPTPKNPSVPEGRYTVYGQYDRASQRILINPGKWLDRPANYYNTIMVGVFDPVERTFSAYFQGVNGCTSFEAKYATEDYAGPAEKYKKPVKKKKVVRKKKVVAKITPPAALPAPVTPAADAVAPAAPVASAPVTAPVPVPAAPASVPTADPVAPMPAAASAPAAVPAIITPPAPAANPAPTPVSPGPASIELPAPEAPKAATQPPVSITPPTVAPPTVTPPAPAATPDQNPVKPSGALEPRHGAKLIQVASGEWFTPTVPQAPRATYITPTVPQVPQAPSAPVAVIAPTAQTFQPNVPQVPSAQIAQPAQIYNTTVPQVSAAPTVPAAQTAPDATRFVPTNEQAPQPQYVPDYRPSSPGLQGPPGG